MRVSMAGASIAVDVDANFDRSNWWSSRSKMTEPLAVLGTVIGDPESLAALESLIGNGESWCGGEGLDEDIIGAGRGGEGHLDAHVVYGRTRGGCRNCFGWAGRSHRKACRWIKALFAWLTDLL